MYFFIFYLFYFFFVFRILLQCVAMAHVAVTAVSVRTGSLEAIVNHV